MKHATLCLAALAALATPARPAENGATLYADNCASCHGANLEGQPNWRRPKDDGTLPAPPHDETGHTWHHDDETLFRYTSLGGQALMESRGLTGFKSGMPGFADSLTDAQIMDILDWIKTQWPADIRRMQAGQ